ncbi:MAG: hypothetical protein HY518_04770 [Candidatus Aenigmarchaeota archaeon]|nr:hypothetical protein [Candidatus Aenigmarchaeota archaeon]
MKVVFIGGSKESSKDAIVNLIVKSRGVLPEFEYVRLTDVSNINIRELWKSRAEQLKLRNGLYAKLKKKMDEFQKREVANVIVNCYFTVDTRHGFFPLISEELIKMVKPDMILVIEEDSRKPHIKYPDEVEKLKRMVSQQEVNIHYAGLYSYLTTAHLKVIRVRRGHVKAALKETIMTLKNMFGDD